MADPKEQWVMAPQTVDNFYTLMPITDRLYYSIIWWMKLTKNAWIGTSIAKKFLLLGDEVPQTPI